MDVAPLRVPHRIDEMPRLVNLDARVEQRTWRARQAWG